MKATVLGIQKVNYVSRKTNQPVTGTTLHVSYPKKDVEGQSVETIFISDRSEISLESVKVGSTVGVYYNRWGSVDGLEIVK